MKYFTLFFCTISFVVTHKDGTVQRQNRYFMDFIIFKGILSCFDQVVIDTTYDARLPSVEECVSSYLYSSASDVIKPVPHYSRRVTLQQCKWRHKAGATQQSTSYLSAVQVTSWNRCHTTVDELPYISESDVIKPVPHYSRRVTSQQSKWRHKAGATLQSTSYFTAVQVAS